MRLLVALITWWENLCDWWRGWPVPEPEPMAGVPPPSRPSPMVSERARRHGPRGGMVYGEGPLPTRPPPKKPKPQSRIVKVDGIEVVVGSPSALTEIDGELHSMEWDPDQGRFRTVPWRPALSPPG